VLSILSNSTLILLKVIAGTITGSVAILTEAVHSSIDLIASIVAFFSVRKVAVVAVSLAVNVGVSVRLSRTAKRTGSPALAGDAAHLGTDAPTSAAVLVGLVLVAVTGAQWIDPVVALAVAVLVVSTGIRLPMQASRVLVDESLPAAEVDMIRKAIEAVSSRGVVGYHELRTRRAGSRRYVDLHVQFREGTSLEDPHRTAHELQDLISSRLAAPTC
jgi:cation diffusion facilitator family transporter